MNKKEGRIIVIDDNEEILFSLRILLSKYFSEVVTLNSPKTLVSKIQKQAFDVYILDMNFTANIQSGNEGVFWLQEILKLDKDAIVIFITAFAGIELAVNAMKQGATDFVEKPWDNRKLVTTVLNGVKLRRSNNEILSLKGKEQALIQELKKPGDIFIGKSMAIRQVFGIIEKAAPTDANILILGENGTGKELVARSIHEKSDRNDKTFVTVDVGALNENLFESELFGHAKGAFTGAGFEKPGRFEIANKGTLFLDEIGNLPLYLQTKLLSVIQNGEVTRMGENKPRKIDVRLICATNIDLYSITQKNEFREDLLYRINTVQIDLPPLNRRSSDIPLLCDYFMDELKKKYKKPNLKISQIALKKLQEFQWPGNVRQLKHTLENAAIMANDKEITIADLSLKSIVVKKSALDNPNFYENEKQHIIFILEKNKGHLSRVAEELGIARSTLYRKMKRYGL